MRSKYCPPAKPEYPELTASVFIKSFFILDERFNYLLDKISNANVSNEFPAKIAVNSLNFL